MENDVRAMIAAEVRAELARQRKTQREAAAALDMTQPALQLRLSGQRAFRAEELAVLAAWAVLSLGLASRTFRWE